MKKITSLLLFLLLHIRFGGFVSVFGHKIRELGRSFRIVGLLNLGLRHRNTKTSCKLQSNEHDDCTDESGDQVADWNANKAFHDSTHITENGVENNCNEPQNNDCNNSSRNLLTLHSKSSLLLIGYNNVSRFA